MRTRAPSGGGLFGGIGYASSNANATLPWSARTARSALSGSQYMRPP